MPFAASRIYAAFDTIQAVESSENAQTVLGNAERHEHLMMADKPWEPRIDNGYPNVVYLPEERMPFKLWYDCCIQVSHPSVCSSKDTKGLLYAESEDGFTWHKPELGLVDFRGSRANNIVLKGTHGLGVFIDPHERQSGRFKAFGMLQEKQTGLKVAISSAEQLQEVRIRVNSHLQLTDDWDEMGLLKGDTLMRDQLKEQILSLEDLSAMQTPVDLLWLRPAIGGLLTSEDGLRWGGKRELRLGNNRWDTHNNMFWDEKRQEYVGITRGDTSAVSASGMWRLNRTVARVSSPSWDGSFSNLKVVHAGESLADQLYAQITFPFYSAYIGLLATYDSKFASNTPEDKVRCELAWSPDTLHWFRLRDESRVDAPGELIRSDSGGNKLWDCFMANKPVVLGETMRLYYMAGDGPHFGSRNTTLAVATLRRDGFAGRAPRSARAAALIISRLLTCDGELPVVTADVAMGGSLRVAIEGVEGPIAGYTLPESVPLLRSATERRMAWSSRTGREKLPAKCRLRIELRNATLYTFGWTNKPVPFRAASMQEAPQVASLSSASALLGLSAAMLLAITFPLVKHHRNRAKWGERVVEMSNDSE